MKRWLMLLFLSGICYGQTDTSLTTSVIELSPRQSIQDFLQAMNREDYEQAQLYVEFSRSTSFEQKKELMKHIFYVLDQIIQLNIYSLSPDPKGFQNDEIPLDRELLYSPKNGDARESYYLSRYEGKQEHERKLYWRIEYQSVAKMQQLNGIKSQLFFEKYLPGYLKSKVLKLSIWQWIGIGIAILISMLISYLIVFLFLKSLSKFIEKRNISLRNSILQKLSKPVQVLIFLTILEFFVKYLSIGFAARETFYMCQRILTLFSAVWILFIGNDIVFQILHWRAEKEGRSSITAILPLAQKLVLITIAILGGLFTLQNLGYNVSALIAGLGVGGIAIALAGQKTIENLLGGFMILMDQPIKVNDFGRYGDILGTVESIGLRSVRIRTLDRTIVTVPNAEFAQMNIENFAKRDKIRFYTILGIRYESSYEQLCYILSEVRKLFLSHEKVDNDPGRIRFINFADYSLELEIFAYITASTWGEFLAIQEDLLLSIKQIVEESGTEFAFPSQTIYWEKSDGLDKNKSEHTKSIVENWKAKCEIPIPDLPEEVIAKLANTKKYPSEYSWQKNVNKM